MTSKHRERALKIAAVAAVGVLAADTLALSPLAARWKAHREEIVQLRDRIAHGESLIEREQSIRGKWRRMQKESLPLSPLPQAGATQESQMESVAQDDVLTAVYRWSDQSGISLTSYKTQWKREPRKGYSLLEAQAGAYGGMEDVARFVYELERDPLPIKIDELELTSRDDNGREIAVALRATGLKLKADRE